MKIINADAIYLKPDDNLYKTIEKIGRTCYKSEDKITNDSTPTFVKMLSNRKDANKIEENDITEFIGQIIDIFEDFLNDKNVILNDSKQNENENFKTSNHVNICGTDYDILQKHIKDTLHNWKIISE